MATQSLSVQSDAKKETYTMTGEHFTWLGNILASVIGLQDVLANAGDSANVHPHSVGCVLELISNDLDYVVSRIQKGGAK